MEKLLKFILTKRNIAFILLGAAIVFLALINLTALPTVVELDKQNNVAPRQATTKIPPIQERAKTYQQEEQKENDDGIVQPNSKIENEIQAGRVAGDWTQENENTDKLPQLNQKMNDYSSVDSYNVTKVIDGDTFKVNINGQEETVRALGIDTPESVDRRKTVECFAQEASRRTKQLLTGKKVKLEKDTTQSDRDKYNRLIRYVYLEDGSFFNKQMISDGYAHEYTYNIPYKYQTEFKQAETEARIAKRGLWADDACVIKSTPDTQAILSTQGHIFYTSSCFSSKYYYCDTNENWKNLSPKHLLSFSLEQEPLNKFPN